MKYDGFIWWWLVLIWLLLMVILWEVSGALHTLQAILERMPHP